MENGNPEIKNGNPVYLGVPLLLRRLLKKGGRGGYYYQVNIIAVLTHAEYILVRRIGKPRSLGFWIP